MKITIFGRQYQFGYQGQLITLRCPDCGYTETGRSHEFETHYSQVSTSKTRRSKAPNLKKHNSQQEFILVRNPLYTGTTMQKVTCPDCGEKSKAVVQVRNGKELRIHTCPVCHKVISDWE